MNKCFVLGLIINACMSVASAEAAGPTPGLNVTVTNPPSSPVPVSIQGTASFNGTVQAQQSGSWNVGLVPGTLVTIANPGSNPVLVREVGGDKERFQTTASFQFTAPAPNCLSLCSQVVLTVPTGKRLFVEHVSSDFGILAHGFFPVSFFLLTTSGFRDQYGPQKFGTNDNGDFFAFNAPTKFFANAGETLTLVTAANTSSGVFGNISISGYLVSAP